MGTRPGLTGEQTVLSPRQRGCLGQVHWKDATAGLGIGLQPVERSGPFAAVETDASIPAAWLQGLDIFDTRIVIEPSSDQLSGDTGRQPAEGDDRSGHFRGGHARHRGLDNW